MRRAEHLLCSYTGVVGVGYTLVSMSSDAADLDGGKCMGRCAEHPRGMLVQKTWSAFLNYNRDSSLRVGSDDVHLCRGDGDDGRQCVRSPNPSRSHVLLPLALDWKALGVLKAKRDLQGYADSLRRSNG